MREPVQVFTSAPAGQPHKTNDRSDIHVLGKPIDLGRSIYVSLQVEWDGLVGFSPVKQLVGWVSNTGVKWSPKTRLEFSFNSASGIEIIPLIGVVCEQFLKLEFDPMGISAGVIDIHVFGK